MRVARQVRAAFTGTRDGQRHLIRKRDKPQEAAAEVRAVCAGILLANPCANRSVVSITAAAPFSTPATGGIGRGDMMVGMHKTDTSHYHAAQGERNQSTRGLHGVSPGRNEGSLWRSATQNRVKQILLFRSRKMGDFAPTSQIMPNNAAMHILSKLTITSSNASTVLPTRLLVIEHQTKSQDNASGFRGEMRVVQRAGVGLPQNVNHQRQQNPDDR